MGGSSSKNSSAKQQQPTQGSNQAAADKQTIAQLQKQVRELQVTASNMASIAIPRWRIGDGNYFQLHEKFWEGAEKQDASLHQAAGDAAEAAHPSDSRFASGMTQLVFDNCQGIGDDMMLTALILARRSASMYRLSFVNTGLTDHGVDFLAAAIRVDPSQPEATRFSVLNIDLSGNPGITAYGARRLVSAMLTRTGELRSLSLKGCDGVYTGSPDDVASVEALAAQASKTSVDASSSFTLVMPEAPEVPFDVDGKPVRLSQFIKIGGGEYQPMEVTAPRPVADGSPSRGAPPLGHTLFLHREDITLKDEAKATKLAGFLAELSEQQRKAPPGCGFDTQAFHGGPHFLCRVRFVQQKARTTVVVVADGVNGKTYADRMADVASGFVLPRRLKLQVFFQICNAASYVHEHGFALRQMRPDLLSMMLERGVAWCRYMDYSPLRPESVRTAKVQTGSHMTFTDPSIRAGDTVSRGHDLYAVAMLCVYAYVPCDNILTAFQDKQYKWLIPAISPTETQIPLALEHYKSLGIEPDVAEIIVQLTRNDIPARMPAARAAKAFHDLLVAEPH